MTTAIAITKTNAVASFIGSSIGKTAAYAVHASIKVGQGTGRFGADVASSTAAGYADKRDQLAESRAAVTAARQGPIKVAIVRKPRITA